MDISDTPDHERSPGEQDGPRFTPPGITSRWGRASLSMSKAALALAICALAITCAYAWITHNKVGELEAALTKRTAQLADEKKQRDIGARAAAEIQARLSASETQCRISTVQLKAAVDAFATQTTSCEAIKRQLGAGNKS